MACDARTAPPARGATARSAGRITGRRPAVTPATSPATINAPRSGSTAGSTAVATRMNKRDGGDFEHISRSFLDLGQITTGMVPRVDLSSASSPGTLEAMIPTSERSPPAVGAEVLLLGDLGAAGGYTFPEPWACGLSAASYTVR